MVRYFEKLDTIIVGLSFLLKILKYGFTHNMNSSFVGGDEAGFYPLSKKLSKWKEKMELALASTPVGKVIAKAKWARFQFLRTRYGPTRRSKGLVDLNSGPHQRTGLQTPPERAQGRVRSSFPLFV